MLRSRLVLVWISVVLLLLCSNCQAIRCRTDDGPSEEDLKRIVRTCMHKVGENDTDDNYNYDDSNSEQSDENTERSSRPLHFNNQNNQNHQRNMQNNPYGNFNPNTNPNRNFNNRNNNNNNNNYNGWNVQANQFGGMNNQRSNNNQFQNQFQNQNPNQYPNQFSGNSNGNRSNNNQTEQDRACLVHCFFREFKMVYNRFLHISTDLVSILTLKLFTVIKTNNEDFPDKRKMIQTFTKDIREQEVREFYVDSIQECFHMVDNMDNYNRRKNKCDVALTIITCLTERAKTNCEDFRNDMMLF